MPELARFYGVFIRMYMEVGVPHNLPHFHAYYQGEQAVFSIDPVNMIEGSIPGNAETSCGSVGGDSPA